MNFDISTARLAASANDCIISLISISSNVRELTSTGDFHGVGNPDGEINLKSGSSRSFAVVALAPKLSCATIGIFLSRNSFVIGFNSKADLSLYKFGYFKETRPHG